MKRKINSLSVSYMLFLILLFLSGSTSGVVSDLIYLVAFILPMLVSFIEIKDEKADRWQYLKLDKEGTKLTLLVLAPVIAVVFSLSALTSFIITALTGATASVDIGNSLPIALFLHAFLPAVLEEMLFRYLPMRLLSANSKRVTVFVSALFFALIHHSFFSIPYAFVAGLTFMAVDLMCNSVWPSVILHFLNNTASVLFILYSGSATFVAVFLSVLGICTTVSLIFIILNRKKHIPRLRESLSSGERMSFNFNMMIFTLFALFIAVIDLL